MKNLIAVFLLIPSVSFAVAPLTTKDQQELLKGKMLQNIDWKDGYVWPEVTIRVLLDHAPKESMDVFMDFESHKTYIPDMLESKVVKKLSPEHMHVLSSMEMPWPVKKSTQVTNNVLTKGEDGSYTLKWNLVEAKFLKSTDGYISFKPYQGKTMMEYVTFIVPDSSFAGMFKNKVAGDVEKTVKKITDHLNETLEKRSLASEKKRGATPL